MSLDLAEQSCNVETAADAESVHNGGCGDFTAEDRVQKSQQRQQQQHEEKEAAAAAAEQQDESAYMTAAATAAVDACERNNGTTPDVCRDFLNNVCFRGPRCKYYHPASMPQKSEAVAAAGECKVMFCKDYLNQVCYRGSCKYVHCAREEKDMYEQSGRITEALARAIVAATGQDIIDGRPLCKEYLSNHCSRGARCRFWHINPKQERELRLMGVVEGGGGGGGGGGSGANVEHCMAIAQQQPPSMGYRASFDTIRELKRRQQTTDEAAFAPVAHGGSAPKYQRTRYEPAPPGGNAAAAAAVMNSGAMCEEIVSLRGRLDMMKQSLVDLMSQNDRLLAENARLRAKLTAANISDTISSPGMLSMGSISKSPPVTAAAAKSVAERWSVLH